MAGIGFVGSAPQSLPAGFDNGIENKPQYNSELSDVAYSDDSDSCDEENPLLLEAPSVQHRQRESSLPVITGSYGAIPTSWSSSRRKRIASTSVASLTQLFGRDGYRQLKEEFLRDARKLNEQAEEDGESEEEEGVPFIKLIYRRTCKDKTKLVILPLLYFLFMCLAGVVAFYSISGLIVSYQHKVRSVQYVTVDTFHTIGIAMFPETFAEFENCEFLYNDDLSPDRDHNWSNILPPDQICKYRNITFFSNLIKENRSAIVFDGPTLVNLKQSLAIRFTIDTTTRNFSAMEYLLMGNWYQVKDLSYDEQTQYLQGVEQTKPLNTVPAGFRTWVKMSYIVRKEDGGNKNITDFTVTPDFSTYNDWRNISDRTTNVIYAVFEWKSNAFQYIHEIVSTNIWNTLGSLAGIFITLVKVGEYCHRWIQRLRREKRKKLQKLKELEEEQARLTEEYEQKKLEKRISRKELNC